ncbi:hypothetical protein [Herbiconiux sp. UC225_62]|uniref:hypothetical protein n=1 Tax=Herbiconiux sp. UC225_62 TaxID=3350168 RepID=UPI0036D3D29A
MSIPDTRNWRFFAPKKPPRLPPKGERWSGMLRPATFITAGVVGALIAAVWIGVAVTQPKTPATLDEVTAEVMTEVDTITGVLGDPLQPADDETEVVACPDGGEQYRITRTESLPATVVPGAVIAEIKQGYELLDWTVTTSPAGLSGQEAHLGGKTPVVVDVTVVPEGATVTATIHGESRCTRPD